MFTQRERPLRNILRLQIVVGVVGALALVVFWLLFYLRRLFFVA